MGNSISQKQTHSTAKVILSDGSVHEFDQPLTAAELMLEHPQQLVVEYQSAATEKRPTPLPADKKLEPKKIYLMLPIKRGKPTTISSEELRRVLLIANSVLKTPPLLSSSKFLPFFSRIFPAEGHGFVAEKKERVEVFEAEEKEESFFCERPEYLSRQLSAKGWKPSLDTIKEKKIERKVSHWLLYK
ncbi:hypothetical protein UlMin_030732 [Ulmus minor]